MKPEEFTQFTVEAYQHNRGIFANKVNAEDLIPNQARGLEKALESFSR